MRRSESYINKPHAWNTCAQHFYSWKFIGEHILVNLMWRTHPFRISSFTFSLVSFHLLFPYFITTHFFYGTYNNLKYVEIDNKPRASPLCWSNHTSLWSLPSTMYYLDFIPSGYNYEDTNFEASYQVIKIQWKKWNKIKTIIPLTTPKKVILLSNPTTKLKLVKGSMCASLI